MTPRDTATLFVTGSGRIIDLYAPKPSDISFDDIAESLAKEVRFNGGTPGYAYSVAQHLVLGADWIIAEATGEHAIIGEEFGPSPNKAPPDVQLTAAYFLAHDFHEFVLKDEVTPKKKTLEKIASEFGAAAGTILEAFGRMVERHDQAIHEAAGLAWPPTKDVRQIVETIDKRILLTEWAEFHKGHTLLDDYSAYEPLPIKIGIPWQWPFAQHQLETRMEMLLPALRGSL